MTKGNKVLLHISRVSTQGKEDEIQAEIIGDDGEVIRLSMPLIDYAKIISGEAHVPVEVRRYRPPNP